MTVQALHGHRPEVLEDLLERFGPAIQGLAYLILRDRALAEDVVVDTLLVALEHGHELRDPDALRPWLLRIATNRALGTRRRSTRVVQLRLVPEPATRNADVDERLALLAGVEQLPSRMRAAIALRYYSDLSVRDVAEALGTSENTVKTQLREGLGRLREALAERDPADVKETAHG